MDHATTGITLKPATCLMNSLQTRYGSTTQSLHWVTAILVLAAFVLGPGGQEQSVYFASHDFERQLHETVGMLVFGLTFLRLFWTLVDSPLVFEPMPDWMAKTSKLVQGALYFLLFAVPATAITGAWLEGHPVTLFAGLQIVSPIGVSHSLGAAIANIHTLLGDAIIWIAAAHAFAAIYHHLLLKDGVLLSMLARWIPLRRR